MTKVEAKYPEYIPESFSHEILIILTKLALFCQFALQANLKHGVPSKSYLLK